MPAHEDLAASSPATSDGARVDGVPVESPNEPAGERSLRPEWLAALSLLFVYFATMSGHLMSMDGLYMARQSYALLFDGSMRFGLPVWTWLPEPTWHSLYGIGLSLLYLPGLFAFGPLYRHVPASATMPPDLYDFYLRQLYEDPLYGAGASWLHPLLAAGTTFLAARIVLALGFGHRAALWTMACCGIGSSTIVYARGDFAQLPEAFCWTAALFAALVHRRARAGAHPSGEERRTATRALAVCALVIAWAVMIRPLEGLFLVPAAALVALAGPASARGSAGSIAALAAIATGAAAGVAVTLLVNLARFGSVLEFGYPEGNEWVFPGVVRWASVLVSPGRGVLWEFPAIVLVPAGALAAWRSGRRTETAAMLGLSFALLVNVASWAAWWGGWCWGLRLFTPAIPVLAVFAGIGAAALAPSFRRVVPAALVLLGLFWALPGITTNLAGGFGILSDEPGFAWNLASYPPYGAWQFLERAYPLWPSDVWSIDILWFRLVPAFGTAMLVVPATLLVAAGVLAIAALRAVREIRGQTPR